MHHWGGELLGLPSAEKLLDRALDTIDKRTDSETDRQKLRSVAIERHLSYEAERRQTAMGWRIWWAVWSLFAVPLGIWFAHVVLDTAFGFPWQVADLPDSIKPWGNDIFFSIFGSGVSAAAIQTITGAIKGRR
ncbi:hypothetical protein PsAD37_03921 [Pseudovibrio sp. Ad37]|nr:hypothetical protein PsAD37_03921 [Pseudovibrio sp. Ad37]